MSNMDYISVLFFFNLIFISKGEYFYKTLYADMKVDHFSFTNNDTFKLRYLINDTYWKPNQLSPIFFYTGNEGDIVDFAKNTGFMWETAPEFNALLVFAEHRYYGSSMPYGNLSFSEPKYSGYLTASQAMMDYIQLISQIKDTYNITSKKLPVVAFGGSYGGMLAAWIRMKYPSIISGSLASSAPIWQFTGMTPCYSFGRVTTSAYRTVAKPCAENIRTSWRVITKMGKTDEGRKTLSTIFKTCEPLKTEQNVTAIKNYLTDMYVNIAMVNYPYAASFIQHLPANPVKAACKHLSKPLKDEELLKNIFKVVAMYINGTGTEKCFNANSNPDSFGDQGWDFQSCTEMVMPMCYDGVLDMFEKSPWNIQQIENDCFNKFKVRPSINQIRDLFGGKSIHWASNIIFSNGLLDPWSSGGVMYNLSLTAMAIIIPESAHHLDLRASNEKDPASIINARRFYKSQIREWIK